MTPPIAGSINSPARQQVDCAIVSLWLALRDLSDTPEDMTVHDLNLLIPVSTHPAVQRPLTNARANMKRERERGPMPDTPARWRCSMCFHVTPDADLLRASHPFRPGEQVSGCPVCRNCESLSRACDVSDCQREASQCDPAHGFRCHFHVPVESSPLEGTPTERKNEL